MGYRGQLIDSDNIVESDSLLWSSALPRVVVGHATMLLPSATIMGSSEGTCRWQCWVQRLLLR